MRKLLFVICISLAASAAHAQGKAGSWDNLNALQPGEKIQVSGVNGSKVTGGFVSVSDAAITVQAKAGSQTIQKQEVRSVRLMRKGHRLRHTLAVAAVGAGAGAGIGAAAWENHGFLGDKGAGAAVGAVIGGVSGAIVGALLPSHKTVFSATAP